MAWGLRRAAREDVTAVTALQQAAYAPNRTLLGVEPKPLQADYDAIIADGETWLHDRDGRLAGVLVLHVHPDHLHLWSVAVDPKVQGAHHGKHLLAATEDRARRAGLPRVTLVTGAPLVKTIAWYGRHGYAETSREALADRTLVWFEKTIIEEMLRWQAD